MSSLEIPSQSLIFCHKKVKKNPYPQTRFHAVNLQFGKAVLKSIYFTFYYFITSTCIYTFLFHSLNSGIFCWRNTVF